MAAGVDYLSSELALKAHIEAVNRDYVCEPRLGACAAGRGHSSARGGASGGALFICFISAQCSRPPISPPCSLLHPFCCADYRTVGGVAGPLVVVNTVKVGAAGWGCEAGGAWTRLWRFAPRQSADCQSACMRQEGPMFPGGSCRQAPAALALRAPQLLTPLAPPSRSLRAAPQVCGDREPAAGRRQHTARAGAGGGRRPRGGAGVRGHLWHRQPVHHPGVHGRGAWRRRQRRQPDLWRGSVFSAVSQRRWGASRVQWWMEWCSGGGQAVARCGPCVQASWYEASELWHCPVLHAYRISRRGARS